ncbi:MopE-related protein [Marinoscillum sp. MHG1-6]|uniref:MopE-related protein n=1 Tax=Marinoscillum sp. MHG1-6 TaxID=2959627 RepID=UPI00215787DE|nr:MopE-related protein [Marinoscillum sp. MHG1-6]
MSCLKYFLPMLIALSLSEIAPVIAQAPEKISYQAVLRDSNGELVMNKFVEMRVSVLQGSVDGSAVYVETHNATTNQNGLLSIEIGAGTVVSGLFESIEWGVNTYFVKTETDLEGGSNYTITGVSQILSVPYALFAKTAANLSGEIIESDPVYVGSVSSAITSEDLTNLKNLTGVNTGDQNLDTMATIKALEDTAFSIRLSLSGLINTDNLSAGDIVRYDGTGFVSAEFIFYYQDLDGDGSGNGTVLVYSPVSPPGYSTSPDDCNDTDPELNENTNWYADLDADGYGDPDNFVTQCEQPADYVLNDADCDDANSEITPTTVWYLDSDGDGYGYPGVSTTQCLQPQDYVADNTDCNDSNPDINPSNIYYADFDSDGYGDPDNATNSCVQPIDYVADNSDCDDSESTVHPGAEEICDGLDNDCDQQVDVDITACASANNATTQCEEGNCTLSCSPGYANCDNNPDNGCEVNLTSNSNHCGSCFQTCPPGTSCSNGFCS